MNFRPLGDRILVQPEPPSEMTASGLLHVAEHRKPEQTGTVVAVGPCVHPLKAEAEALAVQVEDDWPESGPAVADLLRRATQKTPEVKVGDYVVFSWATGQELWVEDGAQRLLILREADILCVVEGL